MRSAEVLYSKGKNDECYTPAYGVAPIIKFIPTKAKVWCPFDNKNSEFVKQIYNNGNAVIYGCKENGQDFFRYEPPYKDWDIIISNPPFTGKREIFERCLGFGKPFALLMSLTWLNDSAPKQLFAERDLQLLMFDKRIHYKGEKKITFSSAYFCCDFLPKQIICEKLEVK